MKLAPGTRLSSDERTAFEILGPAVEESRRLVYPARKVFWNYRFRDPALHEAGPDEALRVWVRGPAAGLGAESATARVRFELEMVLNRLGAAWFLEPIDLIEPGPWLITSAPLGTRLDEGPRPDGPRLARVFLEALDMIEFLHRAHLVTGPLDPADFLIDRSGRWFFLGTDRVRAAGNDAATADDLTHWTDLVAPRLADIAGSPGADWLAERVARCRSSAPATVAELIEEPARGPRLLRMIWPIRNGSRSPDDSHDRGSEGTSPPRT